MALSTQFYYVFISWCDLEAIKLKPALQMLHIGIRALEKSNTFGAPVKCRKVIIAQFVSCQYLGRRNKQGSFFIPMIQKEKSLLLVGSHSKLFPASWQMADLKLARSLFISPPAQNNRFDRKKPTTASYSIGRACFLMNWGHLCF